MEIWYLYSKYGRDPERRKLCKGKLEEARDAISITEDMTITREIEENDDCRTYMKVEGDNFYFLIIEIEKSGEETSCEMAKMICDKKALDNPNFIKFVKKD